MKKILLILIYILVSFDLSFAIAPQSSGVTGGSFSGGNSDTATIATSSKSTTGGDMSNFTRIKETGVEDFQGGHGWTKVSGTGSISDDTTTSINGKQSVKITSATDTTSTTISSGTLSPTLDFSGKQLIARVKVSDVTALTVFQIRASSDNFTSWWQWDFNVFRAKYLEDDVWTTFSLNFAQAVEIGGPSGRESINELRFIFAGDGVAAIDANIGSISIFDEPASGVVSFSADDSEDSQFTEFHRILNEKGYKATYFTIPSNLGASNKMTLDQLKVLHKTGNCIALHGLVSVTATDVNTLEDEIIAGKNTLIDAGLTGCLDIYTMPGDAAAEGFYTDSINEMLGSHFNFNRAGLLNHDTIPPGDPLRLKSFIVNDVDTLAIVKEVVDDCKTNKTWCHFVFHRFDTTASDSLTWAISDFQALVDYVETEGLPVKTLAEVLRGDLVKKPDQIKLDNMPVSIFEHGAVCDGNGNTDNQAAIQAALDEAAIKKVPVDFSGATNICWVNSEVTLKDGVNLIGPEFGRAILSCQSATGTITNACFYLAGTLTANFEGINGNIASNAFQVVFDADVSGSLSSGDVFIIHENSNGSYNPVSNDYQEGEFVEVRDVSTVTVDLMSPILANDGYTDSATLEAHKLNGASISINNINFVGVGGTGTNHDKMTLRFNYIRDVRLENVKATGGTDYNAHMAHAYNVVLQGVEGRNLTDDGAGLHYGWSFANVQNILINGSFFRGNRHGLTFNSGGGTNGDVTNRNILITNSQIRTVANNGTAVTPMALSTHGGTEYLTVSDSIIEGAELGGNKNKYFDNTILAVDTYCFIGREMAGFDFTLDGNDCYDKDDVGNGLGGYLDISNDFTSNSNWGGTLKVLNASYFAADDTVSLDGVRIDNDGQTAGDRHIEIDNLELYGPSGNLGDGIDIGTNSGSAWSSITIKDVYMENFGILLANANDELTLNRIRIKDPEDGLLVQNLNSSAPRFWNFDDLYVTGSDERAVSIEGHATNPSPAIVTLNNIRSIDNVITGNAIDDIDSGIHMDGQASLFTKVIVSNSIAGCLDCVTAAGAARPATYEQITDLIETNNNYFGTGTVNYSSVSNSNALNTTASATALALREGNFKYYSVTGTTNITSIAEAANHRGKIIVLKFADVLTFTDGSNLKLNGNFVTTADDTITLYCDGVNFHELGRSAN